MSTNEYHLISPTTSTDIYCLRLECSVLHLTWNCPTLRNTQCNVLSYQTPSYILTESVHLKDKFAKLTDLLSHLVSVIGYISTDIFERV